MKYDWSKITHDKFEAFTYDFLRIQGFKKLKKYRPGGDKGRDVEGWKERNVIKDYPIEEYWIFQCKHLVKSSLKKSVILEDLAKAKEHDPKGWGLITSRQLSSNNYDWIEKIKNHYPFEVIVIDRLRLESFLDENHLIAKKYFTLPSKISNYVLDPFELKVSNLLSQAKDFYQKNSKQLDLQLPTYKKSNIKFRVILKCLPNQFDPLKYYFSERKLDKKNIPQPILKQVNDLIFTIFFFDFMKSHRMAFSNLKRVANINCLYKGHTPETWENDINYVTLARQYSKLVPQSLKRKVTQFQKIIVVDNNWLMILNDSQILFLARYVTRESGWGTELYLVNIDEVSEDFLKEILSREITIIEKVGNYEAIFCSSDWELLKNEQIKMSNSQLLSHFDGAITSKELTKIPQKSSFDFISSKINELMQTLRERHKKGFF